MNPESARWLTPIVNSIGHLNSTPGGSWEILPDAGGKKLASVAAAWKMAEAAYRSPLSKPLPTPAPRPGTLPRPGVISGGVVSFGIAAQVTLQFAQVSLDLEMAKKGFKKGEYLEWFKYKEDTNFAELVLESAQAASQGARARIASKVLTRRKHAGLPRARVHGYSRRDGKTIRPPAF